MPSIKLLQKFVRGFRTRDQDQPNPLLEFESEVEDPSPRAVVTARSRRHLIIPAIIVLACAVGATQWRHIVELSSTLAPAPASVALLTDPPGAHVMIDGRPRGVTPLTLRLAAGTYAVTIRNDDAERSMTLNAAAGADIVREIELRAPSVQPSSIVIDEKQVAAANDVVVPEAPAAVPNVAGWLSVHAPFDVEIVDAGEVVGSNALARIMLPAGRRDLQMVSRALEFTDRRRIDIVAGQTASISITAPQVSININARPWADVSVDGVAIGQTPIANAMLPIGRHQLVFRHPELGERRHDVIVTSRPGQRISLDLTQ